MKSKWLLEYHFVRGDYGMCKKIIHKVSNIEDPRLTECLIYYQVSYLRLINDLLIERGFLF